MEDLKKIALKLAKDGPVRTLPTPRLIQALFNGHYILKTTKSVFVWEHPYYPQLYIPATEIKSYFDSHSKELKIIPGEKFKSEEGKEIATQWTLQVGDKSIDKVLAFAQDGGLSEAAKPLAGLVKIDFGSVDQWFEEATPIFVHPKDPFKRVDILQSTRHIKVSIQGQVVAETHSSMHLYETGLPCRYYLPVTSILDPSVLRESKTRTKCPYKGEAEYYSVDLGKGEVVQDVIWYYRTPLLECAKVEGLICFYNEKVEIEVDGEKLEKPVSPFSNRKPGEKPRLT